MVYSPCSMDMVQCRKISVAVNVGRERAKAEGGRDQSRWPKGLGGCPMHTGSVAERTSTTAPPQISEMEARRGSLLQACNALVNLANESHGLCVDGIPVLQCQSAAPMSVEKQLSNALQTFTFEL